MVILGLAHMISLQKDMIISKYLKKNKKTKMKLKKYTKNFLYPDLKKINLVNYLKAMESMIYQ